MNGELTKALVACAEKEGLTLSALIRSALVTYVKARGYDLSPATKLGRPKLPGHKVKLLLRGSADNLLRVLNEALTSGIAYTPRDPSALGKPGYGEGPLLTSVRMTEDQIGVLVALKAPGWDIRLAAAYISSKGSLAEYLTDLDKDLSKLLA